MSGDPFPKDKQLRADRTRYRRKVAPRKEWERIKAAKAGPCRVCVNISTNGHIGPWIVDPHHLIARADGGDDLEENIVPLCRDCHDLVTNRDRDALRKLSKSLSESERGYVLRKVGEAGYSRIFGVGSGV